MSEGKNHRRVDRRRFLGFAAGAATGTALGVPLVRTLSEWVAATDEPFYPPRGPEDHALSVCNLCAGGCGLRVRRVGGRPVKVDGNPLHPVSGGRLCPRGNALLQGLFHPDRIRQPLRRVGPRGALESFEPVSWDVALEAVGGALAELRQVGATGAMGLVENGRKGLTVRLGRRLLAAFGSPHLFSTHRAGRSATAALHSCQGVWAAPVYDIQRADYLLSLGSAVLEAWASPVYTQRAYGEFRQGRAGRRGKLVHAEARLSLTGAAADEWLAIRPHTEGVLALGLASALISEDLYRREFVRRRTTGFDEFRDAEGRPSEGLRAFLERRFSLARVATATGLSVNTILRIARELASAPTALAIGPERGPLLPGELFDHLAVQTLNVLLGNIDQPGGVLIPEDTPLAPWPELGVSTLSAAATGGENRPAERQLAALPVEALGPAAEAMQALLVVESDPAYCCSPPAAFEAAIARIPLLVAITAMPTDTALLSDWILPASHALECWDLHTAPAGVPYPVVSLAMPALDQPVHETRPAGDLLLALARRIGGPVAAALPWPDLHALARAEVEGLFQARRGAVMGTQFDEAWVRMMERAGWWSPGYSTPPELWQRMQETGGWWDPFYDHGDWERVLQTPSSLCELRPDLLAKLEAESAEQPIVISASSDPSTLSLHIFEPLAVAGGEGAELPFLAELLDPGLEEKWDSWAEIHPDTAAALRISDHERIRVSSASGSITTRARVTPRTMPGVVAIPLGLGRRGGGRWAAGRGVNPLDLVAVGVASSRPGVALDRTWVSIAPAGDGERQQGEG